MYQSFQLILEKNKYFRDAKKLNKETCYAAIKGIRNLFRLKKENKAIKYRILRNIGNLFEHEEGKCYEPVRENNFWSNNYIEYKSKGDTETLSAKQYVNKIRPYFKDITNNLKKSDTWKIQLTITANFISSKDNDDDEEERVLH